MTDDNLEPSREREQAYRTLKKAVAGILDATVRTQTTAADAVDIAAQVEELTERLLVQAFPGPVGTLRYSDGRMRSPGNPAMGRQNAFAPGLNLSFDKENGRVGAAFQLGAAYEGPPGFTHGGVVAMILDQLLGVVPQLVGRLGMTAYLNITYRRPTPLMTPMRAEAWLENVDGFKTLAKGHILDEQGKVTAEAEGLFVVPRFRRNPLDLPVTDAGEYDDPSLGAGAVDGESRP